MKGIDAIFEAALKEFREDAAALIDAAAENPIPTSDKNLPTFDPHKHSADETYEDLSRRFWTAFFLLVKKRADRSLLETG